MPLRHYWCMAKETLAARGGLAVACEAAGDLGQAIPPYARLMTCANT